MDDLVIDPFLHCLYKKEYRFYRLPFRFFRFIVSGYSLDCGDLAIWARFNFDIERSSISVWILKEVVFVQLYLHLFDDNCNNW